MLAINQPLFFNDLGPRRVQADFSGGHLSSDGGVLLLRQIDCGLGIARALLKNEEDHPNRAGKRIAAQANEWLEGFARLAQKPNNDRKIGHATEPKNGNPFFPKGCLASILLNQTESLVQATHERFVSQWAEDPESSFAPVNWRKMLAEAAQQVSMEALDKLTYTECLKARHPSSQELSFLLADLCHEARMPSLEIVPPPNPPPALLVGLGDDPDTMPDVQVRELPTSKLLAVSVIPFIANL